MVIKIFIPLKDGQFLTKEVMEGLILNDCVPCPITTKGEKVYRESNRNGNILRAIEQCEDDDFFIMDSDVILCKGIIEDLLSKNNNPFNTKILTLATDRSTHGLIYIKKEGLKEFENYLRSLTYEWGDDYKHCTICSFLDHNLNTMLKNSDVKECERINK
jgi:hypothetical protein